MEHVHRKLEPCFRGERDGRLIHPRPQVERRRWIRKRLVQEIAFRGPEQPASGSERRLQREREVRARDVAEQHCIRGVGDDGEAAEGVGAQEVVQGIDCVSGRGDGDEVVEAGHDLRHGHIWDGPVVAVVQEWIAVVLDPGFVDAAFAHGVADPFGDHDGDHDRQDVGEGAGQFEHDDNDADCHARGARESGGCADDGVGSWGYAGNVWFAGAEGDEERMFALPDFDYEANNAAVECADGDGWEKYSGGDLQTEGYGGEEEAYNGGDEEEEDDACVGNAGFAKTQGVIVDVDAFGEEVIVELGCLGSEEGDRECDKCG